MSPIDSARMSNSVISLAEFWDSSQIQGRIPGGVKTLWDPQMSFTTEMTQLGNVKRVRDRGW